MSKFDKIFEARESEAKPALKPEVKPAEKSKTKTAVVQTKNTTKIAKPPSDITTAEENKRRGRPPAKRSDPDYVGFTTYIRKDTHLQVKIALLQEGQGRELSELVETLLKDWVDKK